MQALTNLYQHLLDKDRYGKMSFDEKKGAILIDTDGYSLQVSGSAESILIAASKDNKQEKFTLSYDEACRKLSAILDGTGRLKVRFVSRARTLISKGASAAAVIIGVLLAVVAAFLLLCVWAAELTYSSGDVWLGIAASLFFVPLIIWSIALAVTGAKHKPLGKVLGIGFALLLCSVSACLCISVWSTRADDPITPLHVYIVLTVVFALLFATGIYVIVTILGRKKAPVISMYTSKFMVMPSLEDTERIFRAVRENTTMQAIKLTLDYDRAPSLFESKIGGVPYWDMSLPYPADDKGNKMALLAQLALDELPENDLLPREGMLQFFIMADEEYSLSEGCRVVLHKSIDRTVREKFVSSLDIPTSLDYDDDLVLFPVVGEFAVSFEKQTVSMNDSDARFEDEVRKAAEQLGIELDSDLSVYDLLGSLDNYENFFCATNGHWVGGYPYFTQEDPRYGDAVEMYDTLLFQLDTDDRLDRTGKMVMWGDSGVGAFFINSQMLARLDFSDILYNWDCC